MKLNRGFFHMTNIVTKIADWRAHRTRIQGEIGFVPTMGNLHRGHLALIEKAKIENSVTVVSIFVNPTQFDKESDFEFYPRTIEEDLKKCQSLNVDYVFLPQYQALYPEGYEIKVEETNLSLCLEGEHRKGHFAGMLTIVLKLFNIIAPHRAYFGEKDYQQLLLIKKMVRNLFLDVEIIAVPTVRSKKGLALSSRNSRLNDSQKEKAILFANLLSSKKSCAEIKQELIAQGIVVDYIEEKWGRKLGAVLVEDVRLIDNVTE